MSTIANRQTARWLGFIYGRRPDVDDLAESYHEASKIGPFQIGRQMEGARRLNSSPDLQLSSIRAVKRYGGVTIPLAPPALLDRPLSEVIEARRSRRVFAAEPIATDCLGALLHAGYGVTRAVEWQDERPPIPLRAVPSAGALYPLELYPAVLRVGDLEPGLYHFDPLVPGIQVIRPCLAPEALRELSTYPDVVSSCAVLVFVAAIFGRTRFKYGLRGYRFALLEAGHVGQNIALAAAALGLAAVPLGAFYDRRTDAFLGLDGVNESTLYAVAVGRGRK